MGMTRRRILLAAAALVVAGGLGRLALSPSAPAPPGTRIDVSAALSAGEAGGYARALVPRRFAFPADHGPHPEFRHEWWYYAGNLRAASGRPFGFQLTFFRFALAPRAPARASAWAAAEVYMAHFAVTDASGRRFHSFERLSRPALGLAGASAVPYRVWIDDWEALGEGGRFLPVRLRAAGDGAAVDLRLTGRGPAVLHGDRGLSRKGPEPGNASYYYSFPRVQVLGTIRVGEERHAVEGLAWLDREWGSGALSAHQAGWDWFALQLSDGSDLMFYRLRRRDGSTDPFSAGTLCLAGAPPEPLPLDSVILDVLESRRSPRTGALYPSRWRMRLPRQGIDVEVVPLLPDQEHGDTVAYWEGAVVVRGTAGGKAVGGTGYVELTGYAGGSPPR